MFSAGTIVKVLIPNVVNTGYDYRLTADADLGQFVRVSVMNRQYIGVIFGFGDSGLPPEKIKNISEVYPSKLSVDDLSWIQKMSNWTLMTPGAVLRLIINVPDAFLPPKTEPLYNFNFQATGKITENRQKSMNKKRAGFFAAKDPMRKTAGGALQDPSARMALKSKSVLKCLAL